MRVRDVPHTPRTLFKGFTLVELMVALAVLAILMALGAPQLRGFLVNHQLISDAEALLASIDYARSEAMKRSGTVTICPIPAAFDRSNPACATPAAASDWSNGWMVFIDYPEPAPSNALGTFSAGDVLLKVEQSTLSKAITGESNAVGGFTFLGNGMPTSRNITIRVGNASASACRKVMLNISGRSRIQSGCPISQQGQ